MIVRSLQWFFILLFLTARVGAEGDELAVGSVHRLTFQSVDGDDLSTADDHITIITVVTRDNEAKARAVADLVPDRYLGDLQYRYVTLVNFQRKLAGPLHGLTRTVIRHRLESEAKELKPKYEEKGIARDPRRDLYVIADFNGEAVEQLGLPVDGDALGVFLFNGEGKLLARWSDVPPDDALAKALAATTEERARDSQ